MKDDYVEKVNNINKIIAKASMDSHIVKIPNEMTIHGINKNQNIPSYIQLKAKEWWDTLFDFLESIFSNNGCTLIM